MGMPMPMQEPMEGNVSDIMQSSISTPMPEPVRCKTGKAMQSPMAMPEPHIAATLLEKPVANRFPCEAISSNDMKAVAPTPMEHVSEPAPQPLIEVMLEPAVADLERSMSEQWPGEKKLS